MIVVDKLNNYINNHNKEYKHTDINLLSKDDFRILLKSSFIFIQIILSSLPLF